MVGTWLLNGWKMVVEHFAVVESWLEGGMNDGQDKDGYSADEGVFCRTDEGKADEDISLKTRSHEL